MGVSPTARCSLRRHSCAPEREGPPQDLAFFLKYPRLANISTKKGIQKFASPEVVQYERHGGGDMSKLSGPSPGSKN